MITAALFGLKMIVVCSFFLPYRTVPSGTEIAHCKDLILLMLRSTKALPRTKNNNDYALSYKLTGRDITRKTSKA
jgi:hypothetical protein